MKIELIKLSIFLFTFLPLRAVGQENISMDSFIVTQIEKADSLLSRHRDYTGAVKMLQKVLVNSKFDEASSRSQSNIYHKIAVNYYYIGDYNQAIDVLSTAIVLRQQDPDLSKKEITSSHFLRGLSYRESARNELAIVDLKIAIEYLENYPTDFKKTSYKRKVFDYYLEAAVIYDNLNDSAQAEKFYGAALSKIRDVNVEYTIADFYTTYGGFKNAQGDTTRGFELINIGLAVLNKNPESYAKRIIDARNNMASAYYRFGDYKKASFSYERLVKEIDTYKERYSEKEYVKRMGIALRNLALTNTKSGDLGNARNYYEKALALAKKEDTSNYGASISATYEGLADVDLAENNWDAALTNYQNSIKSLCLNFTPANELVLPALQNASIINKKSLNRVLSLKANALQAKYKATKDKEILLATYKTYQTLDTLITQIRQSYDSDLSRYDIIGGTIPIYEKAALAALQLYENTQDQNYLQAAFNFSSKNKAIVLLEDQQDEEAKFAGIPKELLKQERALKKEFYSLEQEIFKLELEPELNEAVLDSVKQVRFESSRKYEKLIANFEANYQDYYRLKYANQQSLTIAQLSASLPAQTAMFEYFIGLENILIFTLTSEGLNYTRQPKPADFDERCQNYRQLSEGREESVSLAAFGEQAHQLYQLLLHKPLQHLQQQGINRLFIVPDDYLHEISFDALLTEPLSEQQIAAGWGVEDLPYLLRSHAISFVYSNRLLYDFNQASDKTKVSKKLFAGFGLDYRDGTYTDIVDNNRALASRSWRDKIRPLPYAVEEIEKIGKLLDGETWINENATKANFNKYAADYKIVHLAMHGLVEKKQPLNSALIFNKQADSLNYLLTAADLYSSSLKADMVVLSACDTGAGQLQKGEGAMTLARAFNYAGCPSLVASLWSAADEPTKDLMIAFYKHLQAGHPKDVALQLAKLNHLDQGLSPSEAPPHFWSHLAIIGNTSPIDFPSTNFNFWILGLAIALVSFAFWKFVKR